jgi:hypothetical protein
MGCLAENSASKDYNCSWISGDVIFVVRAALGPAMVAASNPFSLNGQTFWEYSRWEHWHLDNQLEQAKPIFTWPGRVGTVPILFVVRHDTHYHAQYDWDVRHVCTVEYGYGCGGGGGGGGGVMVFSANFACGTSKQCVSNLKGSGYGANLLPVEFV